VIFFAKIGFFRSRAGPGVFGGVVVVVVVVVGQDILKGLYFLRLRKH
jgi:hypothetical protein